MLSQAGNFYFTTSKKKGETISITCTFTGQLIVKGVYGDIQSGKKATLKVKETGGQISIEGAVTKLDLSHCDLTSFGTKNNPEIEELDLSSNQLTKLNGETPKDCPNLRKIELLFNQIDKKQAYEIARFLPNRKGKTEGNIYIYCESSYEKNQFNSAMIVQANGKNWAVKSYRKGNPGSSIEEPNVIGFSTSVKVGEKIYLGLELPEDRLEDIHIFNYLSGTPLTDGATSAFTVMGDGISYITLDGFTSINMNKHPKSEKQPIKISEIQSNTLEKIYISDTGVKQIDLSKCPKLKNVLCYNNDMTAEDLLAIIQTLPKTSNGSLYLYRYRDDTPNKWNNRAIKEANKRGWRLFGLLDKDNGMQEITVDEKGFHTITFKTTKAVGETIDILLRFREGSSIELTGIEGTPKDGWGKYKLTAAEASIRGAITSCSIIKEQLTELSLEENNSLQALNIWGNDLNSGVDLSKQHALREVTCNANGIDLTEMEQLIDNLPNRRQETTKGHIRIIDESRDTDTNRNKYTMSHIMKAASLGWFVTKDVIVDSKVETQIIQPGSISFITQKPIGSTIKVSTKFYLPITLEGVEGTPIEDGWCDLIVKSPTATMSGTLWGFNISGAELTSVDMHNNEFIKGVVLDNNLLKSLDFTGCNSLISVSVEGNQIIGSEMTSMIKSLPKLPSGKSGNLYISQEDQHAEGNKWTKDDLLLALQKGWKVIDSKGNPITESNIVGIESILAPQSDQLTIYTVDGIQLTIPIEELPEGIYIIGGKKQIINHHK